jgi:hypothetical protein
LRTIVAVSIADEFVKAIPTAVIAAGTLAAGWVVTQRLTAKWDFYRKRRELDLATVTQFYATYGEFFAIWKIWTMFPERDGKVDAPEDQRRELLARAAAMEGSLETLLVKLAVERELKAPDRRVLACFREGLQCLRESIERRAPIQVNKGRPGVKSDDWLAVPGASKAQDGPGRAYRALKHLIGRVAHIATTTRWRRSPDPDVVAQDVLDVTTSARFLDSWWQGYY